MSKLKIHLICNAHLDPVWQWRWEEGCAETLATFRNAVQIIKEHDKIIFNHNESILYMWTKKYDPDLFNEIIKLVEQDRWHISGGWYLQPDVNIPDTESIIRHIILGRKFFTKYFNSKPIVAYNFDSFGHSGGLPQILKLSGYKMYIHMRPDTKDLDLPADLYRWKGIDGSEILTYRITIGLYHTERDNILQRLKEGRKKALEINQDVPVFWGLGNHGGGATREDLKIIDEFAINENAVDVIHSTPELFYESIKQFKNSAPVVKGDLQRVFTGCYTSLSKIKRGARKSLNRLVQTESLRAASWWLLDQQFPEEKIKKAWQEHLFNDFHDILPGSCTESAEKDTLDLYSKVSNTIRSLNLETAVKFNQGPLETAYLPVTVMNSNPLLKKAPVEFECMFDYRPPRTGDWHLRLFKPDGTEIPCQEEQPEALLPFHNWRRKICFITELPSLGSSNYRLKPLRGKAKKRKMNSAMNFNFDSTKGLLTKIFHRKTQVLNGPLFLPIVVDDQGDSWGTDCWSYRNIIGEFELVTGSIKEIVNDHIRTITESVFQYNHSKIIYNIISYSNWPVLEFRIRIHWNEERKRLKLSIPTKITKSRLFCEVPGGAILRPDDGQEHVHGRWFCLEGTVDGDKTALAVINNGQNGLDFKNGEVRLSVLRSAAYCHERGFKLEEFPARKFMDQGIHDIKLLVITGNSDNILESVAGLADWISAPPVVYAHLPVGSFTNTTKSNYEKPDNLFDIEPGNIRVLACKPANNGNALIVRLQETIGKSTKAKLKFYKPFISICISLNQFEIKTIRIEKGGQWQEVDIISDTKL